MLRTLCLLLVFVPSMAFAALKTMDFDANMAAEYKAKGYEAQMKGDLSQARFLYERAESLTPEDAGVLNDLGLVNEAMGNMDEAEEHYLKAIAVDFKCLPAYSNLGYLYTAGSKFELASEYFEKRVKYGDPRDPRTLQAQAEIDRLSQFSRSLSRKKIASQKESLENVMVLRAKEVSVNGRRETLVNAEVDYQRGLALFEARRYEAARHSFEMCLSVSKGHKGATHMLQRIRAMANKPPVVEAAEEPDKGDVIAMTEYDKGLRLLRDGYRDEAVKAFDRALLFAPSDTDIQTARLQALGH